MNKVVVIGLFMVLACQACEQPKSKASSCEDRTGLNSLATVKDVKDDSFERFVALSISKPVWGERRSLVGDFDGDGKMDTLLERYKSQLTGQETNKAYDFAGWPEGSDYLMFWQKWLDEKKLVLTLESKITGINPFEVRLGGVHTGFLYLKNVGDLNHDKHDEIVYVIDYVDFSNMNTGHMVTYKNHKWQKITTWQVAEFDFFKDPATPNKAEPNYITVEPDGRILIKAFDGEKLNNTNWTTIQPDW